MEEKDKKGKEAESINPIVSKTDTKKALKVKHITDFPSYRRCGIVFTKEFTEHSLTAQEETIIRADPNLRIL